LFPERSNINQVTERVSVTALYQFSRLSWALAVPVLSETSSGAAFG
jgi:hypothetical protein